MNQKADNVIKVLTYTEEAALAALADAMNDGKANIVIGTIADKVKIGRSIMVNLLRILTAAGIIQTASRGALGTMVEIIDQDAWKVLTSSVKKTK